MPLRKTLSAIRHVLPIIGVGLVVIGIGAVLGVSFYLRGRAIMEWELKDKLKTAAAMAALQFDADDIDAITADNYEDSGAFVDTVHRLDTIRDAGPDVRFAYLMRHTDEDMTLEFVADADMFGSVAELDDNENGVIDEDEGPGLPGDPYDISEIPALQSDAFKGPASDDEITVDQWGELISGYAPIRRSDGTVAAVLGIDMVADDFRTLSQSIFSPVALLLVLFAVGATGVYMMFTIWRRRQEMLARIAEERTGLMRLTFHQLGTPLTIMKWSLEELKDAEAEGKIKAALTDHYVALEDAISRMNSILEELKAADLVAEDALHYKMQPCTMKELIDQAMDGVRHRMEQRRHTFSVEGDQSVRLAVDHTLISAVLQEVLENAMRYSNPGQPIVVRLRPIEGFLEVSVIDKGVGVPAKDMPRIFDRFVRGSNAAKMYTDGTGLGLYIAKGIITRAGGTMKILSKEGQGATVVFTLPLAA